MTLHIVAQTAPRTKKNLCSARELPPTFLMQVSRMNATQYNVLLKNTWPEEFDVRIRYKRTHPHIWKNDLLHNQDCTLYDFVFFADEYVEIMYRGVIYKMDAALAEEEVSA